ncbi:efflux RND transporter periplasmic adaptor subunit [Antarcticimicrobium sediminis]|uniref:Efflux RND transporter periplasmic adaptor subunit n=1 Tax=Antarcticimicrobium sediminis TaxID=2546227 RepID=A0A4R5EI53_9RHOB|nr:efflux RND transporter periplasmic adaptor subunit [Antarcticimicrobium sediminis]TDE34017.1 efflux RND transporter periplasmic adaptor subunit [Antarcticimicrobium sediminis]
MKIALVLSLLALPAFAEQAALPDPMPARPVVSEFADPRAGDLVRFVGIVEARTETDLGFPMNGTIAERPVEVGDLVHKGDILARLDPEDLEADVRAAEAGVTVATAQLRTATDARNRARILSASGVGSITRLEDAERALTAAEARLEQAQAQLARAEDMRGFATLKAPEDGVITQTFAEAGASLTGGQPVVRLAGTTAREISIDVIEKDATRLGIGAVFDATLIANTKVTAQATLTRIDPVAASATRTRGLHLTLSDPPVGFRLGALVHVSPSVGAEFGVVLERKAILDPAGNPAVWVVERANNTVHRTPVTLGETFGARVQIIHGLEPGDEVVTQGINSLEDGQIVGPRVSE